MADLRAQTGKTICRDSLLWHRFRRSLQNKLYKIAFRLVQEKDAEFFKEPTLNVVYFDETGLSLKIVVPHGWPPIGKRTIVPVTRARVECSSYRISAPRRTCAYLLAQKIR